MVSGDELPHDCEIIVQTDASGEGFGLTILGAKQLGAEGLEQHMDAALMPSDCLAAAA